MKLSKKNKRSVKRQVDIDLGVKPPRNIIFTSKKLYSRKKKHKQNTNEDG